MKRADFVVLAEGANERGQGLVDLAYDILGQAEIEDDRRGESERVAGEVADCLRLTVFVNGEIFLQKPFDKMPRGVSLP